MQEIKDSDIENLISLFTYNQLIGAHKQTGIVITSSSSLEIFI